MDEGSKHTGTPVAKTSDKKYTRRDVLKGAGLGALALLLSGLPPLRGGLFAGTADSPEVTRLKLGFIPLTDCAPLVAGYEKGLFKKYGLEVSLSKEASWANIRDKVSLGALDGAHMLAGMPIAATLGIGSLPKEMVTAFSMDLNGNAVTLSNAFWERGVRDLAGLKKVLDEDRKKGKVYTFAMVFPVSTHNYYLRYWLASGGIDPDQDIRLIVIPPPQMVANLRAGNVDGYCVGEPWNERAVHDGVGWTAVTDYEIWKNNPEKVFGVTREWAEKYPKTHKALVMAMIEANLWMDHPENRMQVVKWISQRKYVNAPEVVVAKSMTGTYDYGHGKIEKLPDFNVFSRYEATYPWRSHAVWFMTQMVRWGQIKPLSREEYRDAAKRIYQVDLYREAAKALGVSAPKEENKKEVLFDGIEFDPADPDGYVKNFKIRRG
jgi:ABC-type nitrate/sulfonate/bicarbonate transport system substrate-binding protein